MFTFETATRQGSYRAMEPTFVKPYVCDQSATFHVPVLQVKNISRQIENKQTSNSDHDMIIDKENTVDATTSSQVQNAAVEKITTLHSRLYSDIEKIRKWKVESDCEYKQKAQDLLDARQTIEAQRKLLSKIQIENEKLTVNLKEEIQAKNEIAEKMQATRDLIMMLKEQQDKIESRMAHWETVKNLFESINRTRLQEYEDLNCQYNGKTDELNMIILNEQEDKKRLTEQMDLELSDAGKQLERFHEMVESKELHIQQLSNDLLDAEQSIERFKKNFREMQVKLKESEENFHSKQDEAASLNEQVHILKTENILLKENDKAKTEAYDLERQLVAQLRNEHEDLQQKLEVEKNNFQTVRIHFEKESQENLQKCSEFEEELLKLKNELDEKTKETDNLKVKLANSEQECEKSKEEINILTKENQSFDELLKQDKELINKLKNELIVMEKLANEVKELTIELETEKSNKENVILELNKNGKQLDDKNTLIKELQDLNNVLTDEKNKIIDELKTANYNMEFLRKEKDVLDMHLQEINQEKESVIGDSSKIKNSLAENELIIQNLTKENANLKEEYSKLGSKIESLNLQMQRTSKTSNEQIMNLESQFQSLKEKSQDDERRFLRETNEMKTSYESEIQELKSAYERAKQEHDDVVAEKEVVIGKLKENVNSYKDKMKKEQIKEKEMEKLKREGNEMQNEIDTLKDQLAQKTTKNEQKIQKMKKQITEGQQKIDGLDRENKKLKQEINDMKIEAEKTLGLDKHNEKLKEQLESLREELSEYLKRNQKMKFQVDDLTDQVNKYKEENAEMKQKTNQQKNEMEDLQKRMEKMDIVNKHLLEENMKLHERADGKSDLEKKIETLDAEKRVLKLQKQNLENELEKERKDKKSGKEISLQEAILTTPKPNVRKCHVRAVETEEEDSSSDCLSTPISPKAGILKKDGTTKIETPKQVTFTAAYESDSSSPESKMFLRKIAAADEQETKRKSPFVRVAPSPRAIIPQGKRARTSGTDATPPEPTRLGLTRVNDHPSRFTPQRGGDDPNVRTYSRKKPRFFRSGISQRREENDSRGNLSWIDDPTFGLFQE